MHKSTHVDRESDIIVDSKFFIFFSTNDHNL
jgi:hypothetical protein